MKENHEPWDIKIKTADNGWVLATPNWEEDENLRYNYQVFEDRDETMLLAARSLLYQVLEELGILGSKHAPRLRIVIQNPDGSIREDE